MIIPKKSLGQNFLKDKNIIIKITKITKVYNENIIEIGPGLGSLTEELINLKPRKIILIEKDDELYKNLLKKYAHTNIKILNEDALSFNFKDLENNYKIISNLPYNISSKLILKILKLNKNISEIICMIQKEMALKFDYSNGKMNKYKFLSEYCSNYKIKFNVSQNVFYPKPNVDSSLVHFKIKKQNININKLNYFLKNFFINKRKKIKSNKYFSNISSNKNKNLRFEDMKYPDILEIYNSFEFFI